MLNDIPNISDFIDNIDIFIDPIISAAIAGLVLGYLSIYVVSKKMVFISASISQASGFGIALIFFLNIELNLSLDPILGSFLFAIFSSILLSISKNKYIFTKDSFIGMIFIVSSFSIIILSDKISQEAHDINEILFGTAVLVRKLDMILIVAFGILIFGIHILLFRTLNFINFDEKAARVQNLPVSGLQFFILLSIALMIGISARALGALPVFTFSTLPAISSLMLGNGIKTSFFLASSIGFFSGILGYLFSFFFLFPVGASISFMCFIIFLFLFLLRFIRFSHLFSKN